MCNCLTHVRTFDETHGGKYPPSQHAPSCEDYQQERFVRIQYDGTSCVMTPDDAEDMQRDARENDAEEYEIEDVLLTRDQFEAMPDFEGF